MCSVWTLNYFIDLSDLFHHSLGIPTPWFGTTDHTLYTFISNFIIYINKQYGPNKILLTYVGFTFLFYL